MKRLFLLVALLSLVINSICFYGGGSRAQQVIFVPTCAGSDDTAAFQSIIDGAAGNDRTIRVPNKSSDLTKRCRITTLSVPANITLDNTDGSGIHVVTSLTDAGPRVNPVGKTMFYGAGTLTLTGLAYDSSDLAANVPSLRTLGTGSQQAAAGTDARLTDSRAPLANKPLLETLTYVGDGSLLVGKGVALDSSGNAVVPGASQNNGIIGVVVSGATNTVTIAKGGKALAYVGDAVQVPGRYVISNGSGILTGNSSAYPTSGQVLGRWLSISDAITNYQYIDFFGSEVRASAASGALDITAYGASAGGTAVANATAIAAAVSAAASAGAAIYIPVGTFNSNTASISVPIVFAAGASILSVATGQTLTSTKAWIVTDMNQHFANVLSGQGTLSIIGNIHVSKMTPEILGGKADGQTIGSTDNGPVFNAILNIFAAASKNTVIEGDGKYDVKSALLDTSLSNAQIVLPKVLVSSSMLTVTFRGPSAPATPWNNDAGFMIRSTLTSGTGNVIGVKQDQGFGTADANIAAHNWASNISVHFENFGVRLTTNPTNSGIDISHTYNPSFDGGVKVDTDDFGAGGLNPNLIGGIVPDVRCTEPTTSTSWGIKMPMDFLPNAAQLNSTVMIQCLYNGFRSSELTLGTGSIVIHGGKVGIGVEGSTWPQHLNKVVVAATTRPLKAVGANPELAGLPNANTNAFIYIDDLQIEHDATMAWADTVYDIDDASRYLTGHIRIFRGDGLPLLLNPASLIGSGLIARSERPWNNVDPYLEFLGGTNFSNQDNAVMQVYRDAATSDNTKWGALVLAAKQSGTTNLVGGISGVNTASASTDKRSVFIGMWTDAGTNNGLVDFYTTNGGTLGKAADIDHLKNLNVYGAVKPNAGVQWVTGSKPSCNAGNRGYVWYVAGGAGVADSFEVCRKDAADAYAWVALF